nr:hypothetical protein [uncultured Pseudogulbenkiania sp.]
MRKITDDTIAQIEQEYAKWAEFLNVGVGLFSFSLGISCLGAPRTDIAGLISLLFMLLFMAYGSNQFPGRIKELRKAELQGLDELVLIGLEKKYFGIGRILRSMPVFLVGWLFLGVVTLYGNAKHAGWLL